MILPTERIVQELQSELGMGNRDSKCCCQKWKTWWSGLDHLTNLKIGRCYQPQDFCELYTAQLQQFCDSDEVMARQALPEAHQHQVIHIAFVMGKEIVALLKPITNTSLKLATAVNWNWMVEKGAWIFTSAYSLLDCQHLCYKRYLQWHLLHSNKISTEYQKLEKSQWLYVNSLLNPADETSWGKVNEIILMSEWWLRSSTFLKQLEVTWPRHPENSSAISDDDLEIKKAIAVFGTAATEVCDLVIEFIQHVFSLDHPKKSNNKTPVIQRLAFAFE